MAAWTCPDCGRPFGRPNRPHHCEPGLSIDEFFAGRPAEHRCIYDAVAAHLEDVGEVIVEFVYVGIFFKRSRTFAELRPRRDRRRRDRLVLSLLLPRTVEHRRVVRSIAYAGTRVHYVDLYAADDVDDDVRDWLTEAYLSSTP